MELKKLNEVYSIIDTSVENWNTQGQVVIDINGAISINFSTKATQGDYTHIGGANYSIPANSEGHINSSFSCNKEYLKMYKEYTETMVTDILEQLKNTSKTNA